MQRRQQWLFPMMVVAATSVIAFGAVGIAAITGHPVAPQVGSTAAAPSPLLTADINARGRDATSAGATAGARTPASTAEARTGETPHPVVRN
jgi:hypothetical protein